MGLEKKPTIGIIGGTGKFGQWFKHYFQNHGLDVLIASRSTELTPVDLAKQCDIVFVSVPIRSTAKTISDIRDHMKKNALLSDFTSLKVIPMKEMMKAKCGVTGLHPMFGPLVPNLQGQNIVFCSGKDNEWTTYLRELFEQDGAKCIDLTAQEHDRQMALVQALVFFLNLGFSKTLLSQKVLPLDLYSSPNFRMQSVLMARILSQSPELAADIQALNPEFKLVLDILRKQIELSSEHIEKQDVEALEKDFNQSKEFFEEFIEVAQIKSTEIAGIIDRQPIKVAQPQAVKLGSASVGFLGPKGTYSHQAVTQLFPKQAQTKEFKTIEDIFCALNNQEIEIGLVPGENSTAGIVTETMYNLVKYPVEVSGSYDLPIHHCLLARTKNKADIQVIKTHQQALNQCRQWLDTNMPGVKKEPMASTVKAITENGGDSVGFIASCVAAQEYGLNILSEKIEDEKDNTTKFYALTNEVNAEIVKKFDAQKTLILLAVYDRVGILKDILSVFADKNLNLSRLHSIPSAKSWDYYFYIQVDSPIGDSTLQSCLDALQEHCSVVRVLGAV